MKLTKNHLENKYKYTRRIKMSNLGTGKYTEEDKRNIAFYQDFWQNKSHLVTKSKSLIYVDFKKKKIIKGARRDVKTYINNRAAA